MSLVAEDNAIEDTIYHLHRALNSGRIDLERFLRVSVNSRFCFLAVSINGSTRFKITHGWPKGPTGVRPSLVVISSAAGQNDPSFFVLHQTPVPPLADRVGV